MPKLSISTQVDRLGKVKAEIADLRKKEQALKDALIDAGIDEADGKLFHVTISDIETERLDYKGLIEELAPSQRLLNKYTTETHSVRVSVHSRKS